MLSLGCPNLELDLFHIASIDLQRRQCLVAAVYDKTFAALLVFYSILLAHFVFEAQDVDLLGALQKHSVDWSL